MRKVSAHPEAAVRLAFYFILVSPNLIGCWIWIVCFLLLEAMPGSLTHWRMRGWRDSIIRTKTSPGTRRVEIPVFTPSPTISCRNFSNQSADMLACEPPPARPTRLLHSACPGKGGQVVVFGGSMKCFILMDSVGQRNSFSTLFCKNTDLVFLFFKECISTHELLLPRRWFRILWKSLNKHLINGRGWVISDGKWCLGRKYPFKFPKRILFIYFLDKK